MIILAKQKNPKSKLWIKEFQTATDAAFYLKVHPTTIYKATGKYGKPYRVKGWYVDKIDSEITETV